MRSLVGLFALLLSGFAVAADPPSVHGMLLVGAKTLFASHLPMFHRPHDYQGIIEVTLSPDAMTIYTADREGHPHQTIYTIVPERFSLPDKMKENATFAAAIFRGHFERGGEEIVAKATFTVTKVVHFRKLDPKEAKPPTARALVFGSGKDTFAAHLISGQPDFDQVLEIEDRAEAVDGITHFTGHPGDKPLPEKSELPLGKAKVKVGRQLYLEFDDLR